MAIDFVSFTNHSRSDRRHIFKQILTFILSIMLCENKIYTTHLFKTISNASSIHRLLHHILYKTLGFTDPFLAAPPIL